MEAGARVRHTKTRQPGQLTWLPMVHFLLCGLRVFVVN
jgi:hypothetical protein